MIELDLKKLRDKIDDIEGAVNHPLDLFSDFDLNIFAEYYEPVSHDLLSITGEPKDVKKICSHPRSSNRRIENRRCFRKYHKVPYYRQRYVED